MTKASKKSENRKLFLSHHTGIQKRKRLLPAYDNMIEQRNVKHTKRFGKTFCYLPILLRRESISIRVIVRNNTGRRTVFQGNLCSSAHIHIHAVDNTAADFFPLFQTLFRIEAEKEKSLAALTGKTAFCKLCRSSRAVDDLSFPADASGFAFPVEFRKQADQDSRILPDSIHLAEILH